MSSILGSLSVQRPVKTWIHRQRFLKFLSALVFGIVLLQLVSIQADSKIFYPVSPKIEISAKPGNQILFKANNGKSIGGEPSPSREIPHLVLKRNGMLTSPEERSLIIQVQGISVPPAGAIISLEVHTQHEAPGIDQEPGPILVWEETRWMAGSNPGPVLQFHKVFTDVSTVNNQQILTPTDYFQIDLRVKNPDPRSSSTHFEFHQEYAFLLENQWLVDLPQVSEHSPGAAPSAMLLHYYDMLPFIENSGDTWKPIPRSDIPAYLSTELIPAMQEAFFIESVQWGFPWYHAWRSYRPDDPTDCLSVALTDGSTWYHGQAEARGSASISLNVDSEDNQNYQGLTDSLMSTFYHELFHNLQRSLNLHLGGDGDVDGIGDAWMFFSEGSAVLATSVGLSEVQFAPNPGSPVYFLEANGFLAGGGNDKRDLVRSYQEMDPYNASIYWRFMYEHCGGMSPGSENARLGMHVIHNVLSVLYSKGIVNIQTSGDLVEHIPAIMDAAIVGTPSCPFDNYRESLLAFAAAVYGLQFDAGRCTEAGLPHGCQMYDPQHSYLYFGIPEYTYKGEQLILDSSRQPNLVRIPSSFGMQFIEINLIDELPEGPLKIKLANPGNPEIELALRVVPLEREPGTGNMIPLFDTRMVSQSLSTGQDNGVIYTIENEDLQRFSQLGLIITRVDNRETSNPAGNYVIRIDQ